MIYNRIMIDSANNSQKSGGRGRHEDDTHLLARTELMLAITEEIFARRLTQTQASRILKIGQPRVSDLVQGRVERFTVDMLMIFLQRLGKEV